MQGVKGATYLSVFFKVIYHYTEIVDFLKLVYAEHNKLNVTEHLDRYEI